MKNSMGVEMSPRAERIYTFLAREGTGIHQFSTDECVAENWERLKKCLAKLENAAEMGTLDPILSTYTIQQIADMAVDLRNIMRRTPDRRVI